MTDDRMPVTTPQFQRRVYCILGLPFDAHTIESARQELVHAVRARRRYVMVTPNVNFIAACQRDQTFRDALLKSDVSLADGAPIVALARIAGLPLRERVAGSALFESLCRSPLEKPVSVFLFGESHGIPNRAEQRINTSATGAVCHGWFEPGFGSAEALSTAEVHRAINDSASEFLVVALGAQKGQRWIDANVERLTTPAICHLGAVIKMTAGVVRRAPRILQRVGLEWLWRILEEPSLWRRYRDDALTLGRLLVSRLLPLAIRRLRRRLFSGQRVPPRLRRYDGERAVRLRIDGDWRVEDADLLRSELTDIAESARDVELDLGEATDLDSGMVGLLLLLRGHCLRSGTSMTVVGASWPVRSLLYMMCADYLLDPVIGTRLVPPKPVEDPVQEEVAGVARVA
ncbi:MAG: WecB/TagA/CpsF family glycosyltransferase [Burkholderiaceae bacterium]